MTALDFIVGYVYIAQLIRAPGIYTAVSKTTCGGYIGSLGYEEIDAKTFAEW